MVIASCSSVEGQEQVDARDVARSRNVETPQSLRGCGSITQMFEACQAIGRLVYSLVSLISSFTRAPGRSKRRVSCILGLG